MEGAGRKHTDEEIRRVLVSVQPVAERSIVAAHPREG